MASIPMTIEALHSFVDMLASRYAATSCFIGPLPITSRFLPVEFHVEDGLYIARPVMVRCVFPPNTQSRHVVVKMKSSTSEAALAAKLYGTFDIQATGGVITKCLLT